MSSAGLSLRRFYYRLVRNDFLRDGSVVFAATMLANICNYLYHMLNSRILGVDAYGTLATLVAGYSIFGALVIMLNMTIVKLVAELHALQDIARLKTLYNTMLTACLSIAAAFLLLVILFAPWLCAYLHVDFLALLSSAVATSAAIVVPAIRGVLQGIQDYARFSSATIIETIVRLMGVGLAFLGWGAAGAMAGFALGSLAALVYSSIVVQRYFALHTAASRLTLDLRRLVMTSAGVTFSTLALTTLGFVDMLLVKHFLDPQAAGLYSVLPLTGKVIIFSVSFVPTILLPKAVANVAKGENARAILWQAAGATAALSAGMLAIYGLMPEFVVRFMAGKAYLAIAPHVFLYGVATTFLAATTLVATYNVGLHRFAFVPRLCAVALGEVITLSISHGSVDAIVYAVLIWNALGLLVSILPSRQEASLQVGMVDVARG